MKKILMIATGGTIACRRTEKGLTPLMGSSDLLKYVPDVKSVCHADTLQLYNVDSTDIRPHHWLGIAKTVADNYEKYDGFVITHGTDTMAYTAAALSYLLLSSPKPVVITGAQKPVDMENTDARINLYDSFVYASDDDASGVHIVFDGKVILGTRAKKTRSKSYNAFASINYPEVARVSDGQVRHYIKQEKREKAFFGALNTRVSVCALAPSMDSGALKYMLANSDAVIIETYGVGGIPAEGGFETAIREGVEKGVTVVITTQVLNEGSDMAVYLVGKQIKEDLCLLEAYDMTHEAALAKLMWILARYTKREDIVREFYTPRNFDIYEKKK
ncbi:MAG: asparaginase [Clostridia bacterium]|nr:asparaginase [Clostridia bacterium]